MATTNLRPGVFSSFTVSTARVAAASQKCPAVCALGTGGTAGKVYRFASAAEVGQVFTGGALAAGARLLLESGVAEVVCICPASSSASDYRAALTALIPVDCDAVVCDSADDAVLLALAETVRDASEAQRERLGFAPAANATKAATQAQTLNAERVCLCWPAARCLGLTTATAFPTACALAAAVLTTEPGGNVNGQPCSLITLDGDNLPEATVQALLAAGVAVFETVGGTAQCIRAVTTRTKTGGEPEATFRDSSTICVIDEVLQRTRRTLQTLLRGARGNTSTLQTFAAQTAVVLSNALDEGLLASFAAPRVYLDTNDRSVCVVELTFEPATAICQIHIAARVNL